MTSRQAKKLRKQYKKSIDSMAHKELKKILLRVARERDYTFIFAISEFIIIIILIWLLLN